MKKLSEQGIEICILCRLFKVSKSGYYDWLDRPDSLREQESEEILSKVIEIHEASKKTYGSPRIHAALKQEGIGCGKNRVAKLMKENGIEAKMKKKFRIKTTDSNHDYPIAPRLFDQEMIVSEPNQVWSSDITYVKTKEGWLYLAIFLDVFSRAIVGWSIADHLRTDLILDAFSMAIGRRQVGPYLICHSDRGVQYASHEFRAQLGQHDFIPSMSRKGNCYDNAFAESFFHSLKMELIYLNEFETKEEAKRKIFEYLEVWYNRKRLHSSLGYQSPLQFEQEFLKAA